MDEYSSLLSHILHARYKACVALVIAPYLVSEKQEGYRGQLRTGRLLGSLIVFSYRIQIL